MSARKFDIEKAKCQEVLGESPVPPHPLVECGKPGAKVIWHNHDGRNVYVMCDMCAWHSLKNRGAIELVVKPQE